MATPKITMYTPTAGGKSTSLTLYGTHFGTDLDNIRVTVNGVDAEVTGALGNIITANVQRGSGSGPVKVYIGQGEAAQELTYKTEFEYSQSPIVSTYIGSYVPSEKTEKKEGTLMEAGLWKPGSIAFDKEGASPSRNYSDFCYIEVQCGLCDEANQRTVARFSSLFWKGSVDGQACPFLRE